MRYIAAYLLLQSGGNSSPSAGDIKKVLSSVDIDVDDSRLEKLLSELDGKSIDDLIALGSSKLASVPSGGGAPAAGGASSSAPAATSARAQIEEKKEEEKEESDDDMGFGLFD